MPVFTKDGMVHSTHYHRYFEDFMEIQKTDEKGKQHIERVYVGQYYSHEDQKKWKLLKCAYAVLYLIALASFFWANSLYIMSANYKLIELPVFIGTVMLLFYGCVLISFISRGKEMTIWEYKSGPRRVVSISKWCVIVLLVKILASLIFMVIVRGWELKGELMNIAGVLVSALAIGAINRIESKQHYNARTSEAAMPRGGHYID